MHAVAAADHQSRQYAEQDRAAPAMPTRPDRRASNAGAPDKLVSREEKPVDVPAAGEYAAGRFDHSDFPGSQCRTAIGRGAGKSGRESEHVRRRGCPAPWHPPSTLRAQRSDPRPPRRSMAGRPRRRCLCPEWVRTRRCRRNRRSPERPAQRRSTPSRSTPVNRIAADAAAAPAPAPIHAPAAPRPAAPRPLAAAPQGGNAPLSIVPTQGDTAAPARTRTAVAQPTPAPAAEPAPSAGGGYSVQVSSQRSEAEAQSAFAACRPNIRPSSAATRRRSPGRSRRQRRLLPRAGRALCLDGAGRAECARA